MIAQKYAQEEIKMRIFPKKLIAVIMALFSSISTFAVINSAGGIKKVARPTAETKPEPPKKEEPKKPAPKPEPKKEEPPKKEPVKKEEPKKEEPPKPADEEYKRSVGTVAVSEETFKHDKKDVLEIIDELSVIMEERAYKKWLKYIDKESINYWSIPKNLSKAQNRLPVKGLRIRTLEDYFKFVFIPARRGKNITEIRYESDTYIKAVEITEEDGELIYYYFNKINGEWKLHLPPIED
jgi:hypothetical protein